MTTTTKSSHVGRFFSVVRLVVAVVVVVVLPEFLLFGGDVCVCGETN